MAEMKIQAKRLKQAIEIYLGIAYPKGNVPAVSLERAEKIKQLSDEAWVPEGCFEVTSNGEHKLYALRLGQPIYPHMKIIVEECPGCKCAEGEVVPVLFRADAHDSHLHAPAGSPDAAPLAALRAINKEITEGIEAAWVAKGIPTFREFLRQQLQAKKKATPHEK